MQKSSIKKISILGLVLVGASAVTAAVLPNNNSKKAFSELGNDRLVEDSTSPGDFTCVPADDDDCNATLLSSTTVADTGGQGPRFTDGTSTTDDGFPLIDSTDDIAGVDANTTV